MELFPFLSIDPQFVVLEDGTLTFQLTATPDSDSGILTISIVGIPTSWAVSGVGTYNSGTQTWTLITRPGNSFTGGPTLTPPANSDVDISALRVTVNEFDPLTGERGSTQTFVDVIVDAVADTPVAAADGITADEGGVARVDASGMLSDADGSEVLTAIEISGVPTGFTLDRGTDMGAGVWRITGGDVVFSQLSITPTADYIGSVEFTLTVFAAETVTDTDSTTANNASSSADTFTVTWNAVNDAPSDVQSTTAVVSEDAAAGTVVATLSAVDEIGDTHTYALAGPSAALFEIDDDRIIVAEGARFDFESAPAITVTVTATDQGALSFSKDIVVAVTNVSPETLTGTTASEALIGGSDADRLFGLAGSDTLRGFSGTDTLTGGAGRDILTGGAERDIFDYNSVAESRGNLRDRITDFQRRIDDIDLSTIDANTKAGGNQNFAFIGTRDFTGKAGQVTIEKVGAAWRVEADTNGDRRADFAIDVVGAQPLTAADFIL